MNQIEGAINDLDKLTPNQHLLIIFGAQVVVQRGVGAVAVVARGVVQHEVLDVAG